MTLENLPLEELRETMGKRLHGYQTSGPRIGSTGNSVAYLWLVKQYKKGSDGLRDRMGKITEGFLRDTYVLYDLEKWPDDARWNLLDFCGQSRIGKEHIEGLIYSCVPLKIPDKGIQYHAELLKCLQNIGDTYTEAFWLNQFGKLGDYYGAMIFRGLMEQGLPVAARNLVACCQHPHAAQMLANFTCVVVSMFGVEQVQEHIVSRLHELPDHAREALEEPLKHEGVTL